LELIEDISRGRSWLSFARGSKAREQAAGSLAYEYDEASAAQYVETPSQSGLTGRVSAKRPGKAYPGKTYDSVESIDEFFSKRTARMGGGSRSTRGSQSGSPAGAEAVRQTRSALNPEKDVGAPIAEDFVPGSYVRHAKYGRGLVLRREGTGPATKLTVSFPGYGQKKLVEKYAGLQKDA
jgi:DNA helicase-2/ATP-dependent DNA helicase PcrA